jgi:5-bromo-4-chloroindolyl phosphate hydrolysis protein
MTQEALRMALEALEENHHLIEEHERPEYLVHYDQIISLLAKALAKEKALQALHDENERLGLYKDAYAQPEQEPVAHWSDCAVHSEPAYPKGECDCGGIVAVADYTALSDKYVALKAQRTRVGLTDEDWKEIEDMPDTFDQGVAWAQAKLKEKNT